MTGVQTCALPICFPYRQVFGDPDDVESIKFYALDQFKVTTGFSQWQEKLTTYLGVEP